MSEPTNDFEIRGGLGGLAYVNAEPDPKNSTIELQVGRGFRSLTFAEATALGAWLLEATGNLPTDRPVEAS